MTERTPNLRLRAWRDAKNWTRADMAEALNRAAHQGQEPVRCDAERIRRWEVGETRWPQAPYRRVLEKVTGEPIGELGFVRATTDDESDFTKQLAPDKTNKLGEEAELFDTMELARMASMSDLGSGAVEGLNEAVDLLCRAYSSTATGPLKTRAKQRLHNVMRMLSGRLTLAQHRELLVSAAWLSALLGCLHYDAGEREQAETARQAAFQMAKEAGHGEIMAWTKEMAAWFAIVEHRFEEAALHAETGQDMLRSATSATVQLVLKQAQSLARVGDRAGASDALSRAAKTLDQVPQPEHPDHHFVFDHSKWLMDASTCYVWLGDNERSEETAHELIDQHTRPDGSVRSPMRVANSYMDLGIVHARKGDLDAAIQHGVNALSWERKSNMDLLDRADDLSQVLHRNYPGESSLRDFDERASGIRRTIESET